MSYLDNENGYLSMFNEVIASYDSISTTSLSLTTNAHTNDIITAINSNGDMAWTSTPTLASLTLGTLSGVLKGTAGVISGSATTSDLPEGSNLYYTDARSRLAISGGSGISYNNITGVITATSTATDIIGTANQVLANGTSGTPQSGTVTLTLPQSIATASTVQFSSLGLGKAPLAALSVVGNFNFASAGSVISWYDATEATRYAYLYQSGPGGYLEINNQVSGPMLLSTNNSEKMRITSAGLIGMNTTNPLTKLHIRSEATLTEQMIQLDSSITSSAGAPTVSLRRSRGSLATPTIVNSGDEISALISQVYDGTQYLYGSSIITKADGTQGVNSVPCAITFNVTAAADFFPTERMRLSAAGHLGIGETSPDIRVVARQLASTAQISARFDGTAPANYRETQFGYNGLSGNGYGWIQAIANGVAYTPLALNPNGGYVCLGNTSLTSSTAKLQITGNIEHAWDSVSHYVRYQPAPSSYYGGWDWDAGNRDLNLVAVGADGDPSIYFKTGTSATERMRIDSSGNVTIGIATANRRLVIQGIGAVRDPILYLKQTNDYGYSFNLDSSSSGRLSILGVNAGVETSTIIDLDRTTTAIGMGGAPTTTGGYATRLDIINASSGPCIKIQESVSSGRGHIQIGSSATATNNIHIGCEGDGSFYVWNGNWGAGTQKFQVGQTGSFRFDNNSSYNLGGMYGVGGAYLTLYNTSAFGYSSSIGHDGTTMYIQTGAGGNMYLQTFTANYGALAGRMMLDQAGRLSFNSQAASSTINLLGTASAPIAGVCLGGYGYDSTPYHRLELANGAGNYIYYMSQNIVWSSSNNRWEFVNAGGWGGYGSVFNFYGNGNAAFATASNVAGLPSFKTNLTMTNNGNCAMGYNLTVTGTVTSDGGYRSVPYGCTGEIYNSGSATQALVTTGAKLTIFDTVGIANYTTPSATNDNITVTVAGTYQVVFRTGVLFSALSGGIAILSLAIQRNGSSVASSVQYISNHETNSTVMATTQCLVDCAVNDVLTIFGGSTPLQTATFSNPYLSVHRVGSV